MGTSDLISYLEDPNNQKEWDIAVSHPLQSWVWGEFRKKMGIDVARLKIIGDEKNTHYCQLSFHAIPYTPFTIGYFPKGPMPDICMVNDLTKLGIQKKAVFIQMEPNVEKSKKSLLQLPNVQKSHRPLFTNYTFVLDLMQSEEEMLKRMHTKTRYNIRIAEKHGVLIKEDSSQHAFDQYLRLSSETTKRQGFYAHDTTYHKIMWDTLSKAGIAKLWTASYNGEILASWIIFLWRDTMYYPYGASSRNHKDVMAPNLLLWEITRWGKAHGYHSFDLWGAMGPPSVDGPDIHDPWYGFHRFKEGYHPNLVEYIGSYDLIINPRMYNLYCLGDTIRWNILKWRTKL